MEYLAALDYQHLDNGIFLSALARSLSRQKGVRPVILHGDSEYTERVIQTGVMRADARIRSIKDLNHRLVALFADEGISTIGINGYQREFITLKNEELHLDKNYYQSLPEEPVLLVSTLIWDYAENNPVPVSLPRLTGFLKTTLGFENLFIFSSSDTDEIIKEKYFKSKASWEELGENFLHQKIPEEFHHFSHPVKLAKAQHFHEIPSLDSVMHIE